MFYIKKNIITKLYVIFICWCGKFYVMYFYVGVGFKVSFRLNRLTINK
jgi:hypothetical protein